MLCYSMLWHRIFYCANIISNAKMAKIAKHYTLDEEIIKFIEDDAVSDDRSESYIVNAILSLHYKKRRRAK